MKNFCVAELHADPQLRLPYGIFLAQDQVTMSDAKLAAAQILRQARADKDALLQQCADDAAQAVQAAQEQVWRQAAALISSLQAAGAAVREDAQELVIDLVQQLFERLVLDTEPRERVAAALRRILVEAPPKLVDPLLRVHPDDLAFAEQAPWKVRADASLARGSCLLQAASGEWRADFSAASAALMAALRGAVQEPVVLQREAPFSS